MLIGVVPPRRLAHCLAVSVAAGLLVASLLPVAASAQVVKSRRGPPPPVVLPPPATSSAPAPPPETKAYDPQLMRLAEILGALTYLRGLCGDADADDWRARMQALLDAEGVPAVRKDRLAGAFNQGLQGYELSYRTCTSNAQLVIQRFLSEGRRLAQEINNRYRAS